MKFNISLTEEDFLEFNRYHVMNSPDGKQAFKRYRLTIPAASIAILAALFVIDTGYLPVAAAFLAIVCTVWLFMCRKMFLKGIDMKVKAVYQGRKMPYNENEELVFSEGYIVSTGDRGTMSLKYEDVKKVVELERYMYIYADDVTAIIIPWKCIGERRDELSDAVHMKTGRKNNE